MVFSIDNISRDKEDGSTGQSFCSSETKGSREQGYDRCISDAISNNLVPSSRHNWLLRTTFRDWFQSRRLEDSSFENHAAGTVSSFAWDPTTANHLGERVNTFPCFLEITSFLSHQFTPLPNQKLRSCINSPIFKGKTSRCLLGKTSGPATTPGALTGNY
ncbi:hypothetical protein, variant [Blastomyces dermatitidis ATCC 18188]|uniref:Uncharacterized protein n=1 Tax=Ajellomyces dermatitidis (strain ATCC 18188 / CBS 674.68) TaxID=653446 RepID=F2TD71_AJEDA|nr:hypothetical protein BDDG_04123 [Blastomyces dermatitidis ATCC 18188]EQL34917.1 hypothetical protein BDFG_03351 [Blastomyces dermatitidis ATCC 26199]KMW67451.1 hypothetical protein, variant [Blastomyces dermatitidis ATCC 18188]